MDAVTPNEETSRSDLAMLEAWRGGDADAGSELFERYSDAIHRFFSSRSPTRREDLVQQTFLACVEGRDRFRGDSSFRTYLYSIAVNILRAERRAHVKEGQRAGGGVSSLVDGAESPSLQVATEQERDLVRRALGRAPDEFRRALELYFFSDLKGPEIARELGVPEGTVRSRIRRGIDHVRRLLIEDEAFDLALSVEESAEGIEPPSPGPGSR